MNRTDPAAATVHGTNPQNLIEKIIRLKIYDSMYWKEHCFALTAEKVVDKAMELDHIGGTFGGNLQPTPFLCLLLKLLQIQPEKEIIVEFITNPEFKYIRALGAMYLRLVGKPLDIYQYLEPLLADYRKIRKVIGNAPAGLKDRDLRHPEKMAWAGCELVHIDEFVEQLLSEELVLEIKLPVIPKRWTLEDSLNLPPRVSTLEGLDDEEEEGVMEEDNAEEAKKKQKPEKEKWKQKSGEGQEERGKSRDKDRDREQERRKDYDDRRAHGERERDRDDDRRDRSPGKRSSSDREYSRSSDAKKSKNEAASEEDDIAIQNALRAKLGLKPLRT